MWRVFVWRIDEIDSNCGIIFADIPVLETFLILYSSMSFECVSDQGSVNFSKPVAMLWLFSVIWYQWLSHHHHHYYYCFWCHYRYIWTPQLNRYYLIYAMNICHVRMMYVLVHIWMRVCIWFVHEKFLQDRQSEDFIVNFRMLQFHVLEPFVQLCVY